MDRFFCFLLRTKSVLRLKNRSRTGKTDDFSSPAVHGYVLFKGYHLAHFFFITKVVFICEIGGKKMEIYPLTSSILFHGTVFILL